MPTCYLIWIKRKYGENILHLIIGAHFVNGYSTCFIPGDINELYQLMSSSNIVIDILLDAQCMYSLLGFVLTLTGFIVQWQICNSTNNSRINMQQGIRPNFLKMQMNALIPPNNSPCQQRINKVIKNNLNFFTTSLFVARFKSNFE